MTSMIALQVERLSEDLSGVRLAEVPVPQATAGRVLGRVEAASLNYPDLLMTRGEYQLKPELPVTLGGDFAGTVIDAGGSAFGPGSRVWGLARGTFAEYALADPASLEALPAEASFAEGAAYGTGYLTAYVALVERARLAPGEWVLVHGASGGMGLAAVDLAKALGARVIATSSDEAKLARIAELYPVDAVLPSSGFRARVLDLTGGRGADVVFDPVNGEVFDESQRCIAFDGRLLVIGFTSGERRSLRSNIALIKGFSLIGVRAGEYCRRFPERRPRIMAALSQLLAERKVAPHVDCEFPLERWRDAFARMERREMVGKIVLTTAALARGCD